MSGNRETQADIDAWVDRELVAFAPLAPGDLAVLAVLLGYDDVRVSSQAA